MTEDPNEGVQDDTADADVTTPDDETPDDETIADPDPEDTKAVDSERKRRGAFSPVVVSLALAVLLLGSIGLATWAYVTQYRVDQQTDESVANAARQAATDGTVAILSYSPESLDKDFANAKTHLTGDFLNYYSQFTQDVVSPAAKDKSVKTSAAIVRSAVSELSPRSAVVLVFLNQTTTSKANPDGSFTASSVKVGLTKADNGAWLISAFDPV